MNFENYIGAFDDVLNLMLETTTNKNQDYAKDYDAFANFKRCEDLGICSTEAGILTRMTDKLSRIGNLLTKDNDVLDERLEDSVLDLAVYSVILYVYLSNKWTNTKPVPSVGERSTSASSADPVEPMTDYNDIANHVSTDTDIEEAMITAEMTTAEVLAIITDQLRG